jgi:hypothetical protein
MKPTMAVGRRCHMQIVVSDEFIDMKPLHIVDFIKMGQYVTGIGQTVAEMTYEWSCDHPRSVKNLTRMLWSTKMGAYYSSRAAHLLARLGEGYSHESMSNEMREIEKMARANLTHISMLSQ